MAEICWEKVNSDFTSNKSTHYLLHYGEFITPLALYVLIPSMSLLGLTVSRRIRTTDSSETFSWQFYSTLRVFARRLLKESRRKKNFIDNSFCSRYLYWELTHGLSSNGPIGSNLSWLQQPHILLQATVTIRHMIRDIKTMLHFLCHSLAFSSFFWTIL